MGNKLGEEFYDGEGKCLHVDMAGPANGSDGRGLGMEFLFQQVNYS